MKGLLKYFILTIVFYNKCAFARSNNAFDLELYENVLNSEECERQLTYINNNATFIRLQFMDASWRIPRSILKLNTRDFGSYFQCLDINQDVEILDMKIDGKYCSVGMSFANFEIPTFPTWPTWPENGTWPWPENGTWPWPENGTFPWPENGTWPEFPWPQYMPELPWSYFEPENRLYTEETIEKLTKYENSRHFLQTILGESPEIELSKRTGEGADFLRAMRFELAVCVPKVCTSKQALDFFSQNLTQGMDIEESFCRLPDDKLWVPADTVAVVILSIIGFITVLSTLYDVRHTIILKRDPKKANKIYQSFSVYTNGKTFFIFPSGPSVVTCLDGIRSFAMIWVIIGHTFVTQLTLIAQNPLDIFEYITRFTSLWVTSGTITVDTFFMISGLLVVYTSASKISRNALIKNLHLFYLNRLLRMFPVLAFGILMTASFLYRTTDGPHFNNIATFVNNCRNHWWSTLLYVQNFVHPQGLCLPHSWYLAIDMQLHFFSPVVLFFVLGGRKRIAWTAIITALVGFIAGASVYNFINDFPSAVVSLSRDSDDGENFMFNYYIHTLPRAAPFFVGMVFGYLLHLHRGQRPRIPMILNLFLWVLALCGTTGVVMVTYWNIQADWDNQLMDNIFNSYKRPIWAASVGWLVFACHNGYGGIVNWILSLHVFKILGRLSYAMYILHYPLIYLLNGTALGPIYFATNYSFYRFFVDFTLAVIAAFLVTIIIDFPFANLIKMGMALAAPRRHHAPKEKPSTSSDQPEMDYKRDELDFPKEEPPFQYGSVEMENEKKTKL